MCDSAFAAGSWSSGARQPNVQRVGMSVGPALRCATGELVRHIENLDALGFRNLEGENKRRFRSVDWGVPRRPEKLQARSSSFSRFCVGVEVKVRADPKSLPSSIKLLTATTDASAPKFFDAARGPPRAWPSSRALVPRSLLPAFNALSASHSRTLRSLSLHRGATFGDTDYSNVVQDLIGKLPKNFKMQDQPQDQSQGILKFKT
ncbi:hypothetical protein DFH09DRAFT_1425635 [Mycena vulgaris]|nr:hypothetical protein DFH09DRAFT_1425635 [Mycena vulgaris]